MKERKGDLIFWEISEMNVTKDLLEHLGFDKYVPRNDFKSALIKVLMQITKGNEKLYRRFNDVQGSVSFGVFYELVTGDNISINKELIVKLDKEHGNISFSDSAHPLVGPIRDLYATAKETLDSRQVRSMILKIVKGECYGIAMRSGGGIYFLDKGFDHKREKLTEFFKKFPTTTKLHTIPMYDDNSTADAIEYAAKEDIFGDIDSLVADIDRRFKEGSITRRQLEGDKERASKILEKIKVHRDNLRKTESEVTAKLTVVSSTIEKVLGRVEDGLIEPADFMSMLGKL